MNNDGHLNTARFAAPVRVAVVGAGQFGKLHAHAFRSNPDCTLVAIVDRDLSRARAVAGRSSATAFYASLEELIQNEQIDAVSIATAGPHHLQPARVALAAGMHVLLEKPVVMTSEDGEALRVAAAASSAFIIPAHILRFATPYRELKSRVDSGVVGTPRALSFRRHRTISHDQLFGDVHPVLMTMVHDIDLALWLDGSAPIRVTARELRLPQRSQPSVVWAEVETVNGSMWSFQCSWSLAGESSLPDSLEVIGERGCLALSLSPRIQSLAFEAGMIDDALTPGGSHGALQEEIRHLVDAVRFGGLTPIVTLDEALAGIALAEQIIAAAQANRIGLPT